MTQHTPCPRHLAIFAKYWEPGRVKTRLAETIGPLAACRLHRAFVGHLWTRFDNLHTIRTLALWPPESVQTARPEVPLSWNVVPQRGNDLGARMGAFFQEQLQRMPQRLVLIGADSPDLPAALVERAFAVRNDYSVVLGPAADGGYYLVGMREWKSIFDGIPWGTSDVLTQTVRRLDALGTGFSLLESWSDVDQLADLQMLRDRLAARPEDHDSSRLLSAIRQTLEGDSP